ncbi:MAG: TA system VapC family ribonuclease toxin [Xanthomonadales bacterium]|nr:TA system VapC family ribonuclease toxin [Xanthomonadales bacterium]
MFVVDTNVLLYAVDADSEFHVPCRNLIEKARGQAAPWFLTWGICYEFLRVSTHPNVYRHPWNSAAAWQFLDTLLACPGLSVLTETRRHAAVLRQCLDEMPETRGNLIHDLHTATLMREHGIARIVTRDTDFHRFGFLEVIDPLRER